jgi:hypothetical protein
VATTHFIANPVPDLFRQLSQARSKVVHERLLESAPSTKCRSRLLAVSAPKAGTWKRTVPSSPDLILSDDHFSIAIRHDLNLPPAEIMPDRCRACDADFQLDPWHALNCQVTKRQSVTHRHDDIVRLINVYSNQIGLTSRVEPRKLDEKGSRLRPDLEIHMGVRNLVLADVVVSNPFCATHEVKGASGLLKTATHSANRKCDKYKKLADDCKARFVPLAFEVYGGFEERSTQFIKDLAKAADSLGYDWAPDDVFTNITRRIAVAIQRGNGNCVLKSLRVGLFR